MTSGVILIQGIIKNLPHIISVVVLVLAIVPSIGFRCGGNEFCKT
jgi:hypothetical protein